MLLFLEDGVNPGGAALGGPDPVHVEHVVRQYECVLRVSVFHRLLDAVDGVRHLYAVTPQHVDAIVQRVEKVRVLLEFLRDVDGIVRQPDSLELGGEDWALSSPILTTFSKLCLMS